MDGWAVVGHSSDLCVSNTLTAKISHVLGFLNVFVNHLLIYCTVHYV